MKLQRQVLFDVIKKNRLWINIFLLIISFMVIFYLCLPNRLSDMDKFFIMISYPQNFEFDFITILFLTYQIVWAIYLFYLYYTYELEYSFENVILRCDDKKWLLMKFLVLFIFTVLYKTIYTFLIYAFFFKKINFNIDFVIYPIIYSFFLATVLFSCINFVKEQKIFIIIITLVSSYLMFIYFNIWGSIILGLVLLIINFLLFNFKRYYNNS